MHSEGVNLKVCRRFLFASVMTLHWHIGGAWT